MHLVLRMRWFDGDVVRAIAAAKRIESLFIVFVTGGEEEEASLQLKELLKDDDVAARYREHVCIRVERDSPTFGQFSQIYPVLIVPCIVYIDSATGMDLEVTADLKSKESVLAGLARALEKRQQGEVSTGAEATAAGAVPPPSAEPVPSSSSSSNSSTTATNTGNMEARVSRARELLDENVGQVSGGVEGHDTPTSMEERVERAKRLMQQRKQEKERQEQEREKEKELERRALGKNLLDFKHKQEEEEMKKAALERRKDKEEEQAARERVRAQIEQDRADRAARFNREKAAEEEKRAERMRRELQQRSEMADQAAADRSSVSRVQFRLPDGRSQTHQFPADAPLGSVYSYVETEVQAGFSQFSLSTSFPRRELDSTSRSATLRELQLVPSATVLVLPKGGGGGGGGGSDGSLSSYLSLLLYPFTLLWGLLLSLVGGGQAAIASATTPEPARTSTARSGQGAKIGRIRRSERDGDDENNTYNGNSTQQM